MANNSSTSPGDTFDGIFDRADRQAIENARARIETVRKGNVTVHLTDNAGQPFQGRVEIDMLRHAFPFGAALSHTHRLTPEDEAYPAKEAGLQAGATSFRGFYGTYRVSVDGYRPATFDLVEGVDRAAVQLSRIASAT